MRRILMVALILLCLALAPAFDARAAEDGERIQASAQEIALALWEKVLTAIPILEHGTQQPVVLGKSNQQNNGKNDAGQGIDPDG